MILTLRQIAPDDYLLCWQLRNDVTVRKWLPGMVSYKDFTARIKSEGHHFLAGVVDNAVVGYAQLAVHGPVAVSLFAAIQQDQRRKTFGTQLCNSACLWALHNGYERILASVSDDNAAGKALLEKCQFRFDGYAPSKKGLRSLYVRA